MTRRLAHDDGRVIVWQGDALDVLRAMPAASVDAVCTDPPYGLEFMGKEWDRPWAVGMSAPGYGDAERLARPAFGDSRNANCRACGGRQRGTNRCSCSRPMWDRHPREDMRAFGAWCEAWAVECLRVLKPGGHLLAFGGTRTSHRLTCAIEDAGFEIRDTITWLYGSGFPKSRDVGKAIDRQRDDRDDIHRVTAFVAAARDAAGWTNRRLDAAFGFNGMAGHWTNRTGPQAAVPTWEQWLKLRELLGFGTGMDADVWRLNGRKGTPGEAWAQREVIGRATGAGNGSVVGLGLPPSMATEYDVTVPATVDAARWDGWGTALKPASEPIVVARKPLAGTVAANVLAHGTGALNIDGCRVEHASAADLATSQGKNPGRADRVTSDTYGADRPQQSVNAAGRWPSNVVLTHTQAEDGGDACADRCVPGCPVADLDAQSGESVSRDGGPRAGAKGDGWRMRYTGAEYDDQGGASRFFPTFRYQAKADSVQRPRAGSVAHPTVKPLALMRWLVRLVTPPAGLVLDPFAGSGTTGEAAHLEGARAVLIEREADYLPLILDRLTKRTDPVAHLVAKARRGEDIDLGLFADLEGA